MKILILILAVGLFSCHNESAQKKVYNDSALYYANKMKEIADSGYSSNDSIRNDQKTRALIYKTMWQSYVDKAKESK